jgi:hypothetical protein
MTNNDQRRAWMDGHLDWAAHQFGVTPIGEAVHTTRLRSVGIKVNDGGEDAWLRVVYEDPDWGAGDYLTGNLTANDISGVPKPHVKRWKQWDDNGRRLRGEVSTFVPAAPLSTGMVLMNEVDLPDPWMTQLRAAVDAIANHPLPPRGVDPDDVNNGLRAFFGITVDFATVEWTTAHSDLHWGNITAPDLFILDWETWGRAPAGYDAATLYCTSLLCPATARRVHRAFSDVLDTRSGRLATLAAAVRFLRFIDGGEYLPLSRPLRQHAHDVIDRL